MNMNRQQQEQLIAEFLDGSADHNCKELLLRELKTNPELKQTLAAMLLIQNELYHVHQDHDGQYIRNEVVRRLDNDSSGKHFTQATLDQIKRHQRKPTRNLKRRRQQQNKQQIWWVAAAAAVLLISLLAWPEPHIPVTIEEKPIEHNRISVRVDAQSIGEWKHLHAADLKHPENADQRSTRCYIGDTLSASRKSTLILDDDSEIIIHPQSRISIHGDNNKREIYLHYGSIEATISKQLHEDALIFPSPHGRSRIVGTAFHLLSNDVHSRLTVLHGRIEQEHTQRKEKVFVNEGQYVDIIPDEKMLVKNIDETPVIVQRPKVIESKPEPIVEAAPVALKPEFFEWPIQSHNDYWIRGTFKDAKTDSDIAHMRSEENHSAQLIYARIPQAERQSLLESDELRLLVQGKSQSTLEIRFYIADQNKKTPSRLQYLSFEHSIADDSWHKIHIPLDRFKDPHKLLAINHGCFAIRILADKRQPFSLQRAYIHRPE